MGEGTLLGTLGATLLGCASPVVVVARDPTQTLPPLPPGIACTVDAVAGRGPLAGLAAGLHWLRTTGGLADTDAAFVTACDHPWLTAAAVQWLAARLGEADVVLPRVDGAVQPLCALYRLAVRDACDRLLAAGEAAPSALLQVHGNRVRMVDTAELRTFDPELRFLANVNTPDEYERARRRG